MKNQTKSSKSLRGMSFMLIVLGFVIAGLPAFAQISGPTSLCAGTTANYSATPTGGTWTTSNTSIATIGSASGVLTGVSGGTVTLSYTKPGADKQMTVVIKAKPSMNAGSNATICAGSSATLTSTGAGTGTYSWAPATGLSSTTASSVTANPSTTTTYTVTGTNGDGCVSSASVMVSVNAIPSVSAGGTVTICSGNTATLSASGAATYSWAPSTCLSATTGSSLAAAPSVTTIYTVIGTSNGCSGTATESVSVNALPSVSAGSGVAICNGSSTSLTASGATTYSWTPSTSVSATTGASVTATPTATTIYTVTGTNAAGCSNIASVTVTVNALPSIGTGSSSAICAGSSATLTATGGASYSWAPSNGLSATTGANVTAAPSTTTTTTTTYTVTGTSAAGCSNNATVTVTINAIPSVSAGSVAICNGSSATMTAAGAATYSWAPSTGLSATTGGSVTANPSATTIYTVTGASAAGCMNTASATVTVNALPTVSAGSVAICNGASATLSASGATTYNWAASTGLSATTGASVTATPTATTIYTVTGTNASGCSNTATATVTVLAAPVMTSVATGGAICAGNTLSLNSAATGGTGALNYSWSGPNTFSSSVQNPSISAATSSATGVYTVTVADSNGCAASGTNTVSAVVSAYPSAGTITGANGICQGSTTTLTNSVSGGVWSAANSIISIGSATGVVTGVAMGTVPVTYTITNSYSCISYTTRNISVNGVAQYIYTYTGTGTNASNGDGGPAHLANIMGPRALSTDTVGNLFICDVTANVIRKVSVNGIITTVAGNGTNGSAGDGGAATAAQLSMGGGGGLYVDVAGNIYIGCTQSNKIRKVNASTGIITTIAGTGVAGFSGDGGPASAAKVNLPLGITADTAGNIYVADQGNYRIRKIDAAGIITTIIGTGSNYYSGDGGPGTAARLSYPRDVTADRSGNLYIVDNGNNVIRKYVMATGIITTLAGNHTAGSAGDGGPATAAQLNCPARIVFDGSNNLYIADQTNNKIRQVNLLNGTINTVVATGTGAFSGDGGPSSVSNIWAPAGVAIARNGNLFIADANNRRVRLAPLSGAITITATSATSVTSGTPVSFVANTSITSTYASLQWQKNGANVGTGATSYTDSLPSTGDVYTCLLNMTPDCGASFSDTSNAITVLVAGHRASESTTAVAEVNDEVVVRIFPNPVHDQLNITATGVANGNVQVNVIDQLGRTVANQVAEVTNGQVAEKVDMTSLPTGMYIITLTDNAGKTRTVKCVKN